ncbi:MAG: hypothetical protein CL916_07835 [Deltaproteobacteria bacterium]|nr:hypothetical protein [Deltaproteobacteria bacterium]
MSKVRNILFRFFVCFVVVIVGLVALEFLLRYKIGRVHTQMLPQKMIDQHVQGGFRYDPDLMWYWSSLPHKRMGVNEFGFRRRKPMVQKIPPDVIRVITLGDSQVYGGGVQENQTFSYYAEQILGNSWEVLNGGISGYRSLNIYRLLRKKIVSFDPDIVVVDAMMWDSPQENGDLHEPPKLSGTLWMEEVLWNSRLNYLIQMSVRSAGIQIWEDLPWPIHLQDVRVSSDSKRGEGLGNHSQIAQWAKSRGIMIVFMEYPTKTQKGDLSCLAREEELPKPVFSACTILQDSGMHMNNLFLDSNHLTPLGGKVLGQALAKELPKMYQEWRATQ